MNGTQELDILLHKIDVLYLTRYSNADWVACPNDRKITCGLCVFLGNSLVFWRSGRHKVVFRSSTNADFRSLANTITEISWIQKMLVELYVK